LNPRVLRKKSKKASDIDGQGMKRDFVSLMLRSYLRSSEQKFEEGEMDELQAGIEFLPAVLLQTATFLESG
jgi:hypothetical protein